jgi:hypothetical protein
MGSVLPGMNQGANLLTTPLAKFIDTAGPMANKVSTGFQMGSKLGNLLSGQQQQAQRPIAPPAPPPAIPQGPAMTKNMPSPADIAAWHRVKRRQQMGQQARGMMA